MAKKTRYPTRSNAKPAAKQAAKPAARPNVLSPVAARPAPAAPVDAEPLDMGEEMPLRSSAALTDAEMERAARLEADMVAKERAAIAESLRRKARAQAGDEHHDRGDINAPLKVRMSHEYAYVARDVKRIALTAGLMIGILAILHVLVNVMGVIKI